MHWYAWWKLYYPKKEGGMGFWDFHSFNLAMLAKQVWQLIDDPESLCAWVLCAKYFPDGDILKARQKLGSSFTGQSILAGITTFKRGYIWRVGNGEKINIWSAPWIPSSPDRKVISPRSGAVYTRVSDLIEPITEQWTWLYFIAFSVRLMCIGFCRFLYSGRVSKISLPRMLLTTAGILSPLDTTYNGAISLVRQLLNSHFQCSKL
jgi:hypothetical protein